MGPFVGLALAIIPAVEKKAARGKRALVAAGKSNPYLVPRLTDNTTLGSIHLERYE